MWSPSARPSHTIGSLVEVSLVFISHRACKTVHLVRDSSCIASKMYDVEGAAGPPEQTVVGRTLDVDVGVPPASLKHSVAGLTDVKSSESDSTMGDETASYAPTDRVGGTVTDVSLA